MQMDLSSEFKIEIQFEERRLQKDSHPQDSLVNTHAILETGSQDSTLQENQPCKDY